mgnify:FL=1
MEKKEYTQEINITDELMAKINELISEYPADKKKSALLPVLHVVQDAHDHWLSVPLMDKVAEILEITPIEVYEVVTFYSMYNQKPVGKYHLEFCRTTCCAIMKADELIEYTCNKLGVKVGEITPDGMFRISTVECLGACGFGPMLQLGDNYHEHLTKEKIDKLIEDCKEGKVSLF